MRFFFYGSLLDPTIRATVMGQGAFRATPAVLQGYRRRRRHDAIYPVLERRPGSAVEGLLVDGIDAAAAARLAAFEGDAYRVARVEVIPTAGGAPVDAFVFLPRRPLAGPAPWDWQAWRRGRRAAALRWARREMASEGRISMRAAARGWTRTERLWRTGAMP